MICRECNWGQFILRCRNGRIIIIIIIIIILSTPGSKDPGGLQTKIKNKLEWLRVGIVLNWESLVKEDWIKPLNQDTDPLE